MECLTLAPSSDRILVELLQILKDDAVESAALNMQFAICTQYAICRLPAKHDKISTMLWRFTFLFTSVSFYITYFKSLLVVYIFIFFTLPSLIEHLNYEMALYEQNFLLRSILYFNDY